MKTIIAGSRTISNYDILLLAIKESEFDITEVVTGVCSDGVDPLGERWAHENDILVKPFPANWKQFGNSAGMIRNVAMAEYADALVAVWDGVSPGTKDMIYLAIKYRLLYYVHNMNGIRLE